MKAACRTWTPLSRREVLKVKTRALRKGVWYRVLTKVERACVDLVIEVVQRVRSGLLSRVLSSLLRKLDVALESPVQWLMREKGFGLASRLGLIAQKWGNKSAAVWAQDAGFMRYLVIIHMNGPP